MDITKITIKNIEPIEINDIWYLKLFIEYELYGKSYETIFTIEMFDNNRNNYMSLETIREPYYHYLKGNFYLNKGIVCGINGNTYNVKEQEIVFKEKNKNGGEENE